MALTRYEKKKKAIIKLLNNVKAQVKNNQLDEDALDELYNENRDKGDGDFDDDGEIADIFDW